MDPALLGCSASGRENGPLRRSKAQCAQEAPENRRETSGGGEQLVSYHRRILWEGTAGLPNIGWRAWQGKQHCQVRRRSSFRASEASRGIAVVPKEGPLYRDDGDSSTARFTPPLGMTTTPRLFRTRARTIEHERRSTRFALVLARDVMYRTTRSVSSENRDSPATPATRDLRTEQPIRRTGLGDKLDKAIRTVAAESTQPVARVRLRHERSHSRHRLIGLEALE